MSHTVDDGPVLAAELRVATAQWRMHALDCRQCNRATRDLPGDHMTGTTALCFEGQRLHGTMQGHRARIATHANGGRPLLRVVA